MNTAVVVRSERERFAGTVCNQCKHRKKSCNKSLPSCSRCSRLLVRCSYSEAYTEESNCYPLPRVVDILSGFDIPFAGYSSPPQQSSMVYKFEQRIPCIDDQVSLQASRLLSAISRKRGGDFMQTYFRTFHKTLPIINKEGFRSKIECSTSDSHFSTLLLSMFLITQLTPQVNPNPSTNFGEQELYPTVKSIYSLLQSTGKVSMELVQAGILVACYEHCQAMHQDAWLSIGACVRMAHLMGLHTVLRKILPKEKEDQNMLETKRCLWWGIVVIERVINAEYEDNRLPLASEPPTPEDFLPRAPLDADTYFRVKDDFLLPDDVVRGPDGWQHTKPRDFTVVGTFGAAVQAAFLASNVTRHIFDTNRDLATRADDAHRLDIALQSFIGSCIPPPGQSHGGYCGAFAMRTCFSLYLLRHEMEVASQLGNASELCRLTIAMQSAVRTIIYVLVEGMAGMPMDLDALAFWSHHMIYLTATLHIKFGIRDDRYSSDLEAMIEYLRYFASRYKLYSNDVRKLELSKNDPPTFYETRAGSSSPPMQY
ncbi:hypothetical protein N431DRAFT_339949 [Stipitochalara longipes BDJ]|nr:hypothetical protein N431DRAFT_339949 [Stipitochalara longipes BDJ]